MNPGLLICWYWVKTANACTSDIGHWFAMTGGKLVLTELPDTHYYYSGSLQTSTHSIALE